MSLQTNRLRDRAKVLRQGDWSDGADDAALMEQAADTIESLRDRLQAVGETCELEPLPAIVVTMNMLNEIGWCKCSKCGYATPDESNYCQNCGANVKAVNR